MTHWGDAPTWDSKSSSDSSGYHDGGDAARIPTRRLAFRACEGGVTGLFTKIVMLLRRVSCSASDAVRAVFGHPARHLLAEPGGSVAKRRTYENDSVASRRADRP